MSIKRTFIPALALFLSLLMLCFAFPFNSFSTSVISGTVISSGDYEKTALTEAIFPTTVEKQQCSLSIIEKMELPKAKMSTEGLLENFPFIKSFYYDIEAISIIQAVKKQQTVLDESAFFSNAPFYWIITVEDETAQQCIDTTQDFGLTITKAHVDYRFRIKKDGNIDKYRGEACRIYKGDENRQASADFSDGVYLAETYYVKDDILHTSLGAKQKPLQAGHQYLIRALYIATSVHPDYDEFTGYVNTAPFYAGLPIMLFDETNFYDMNDLGEDIDYADQLTASGLYSDYKELQYGTGKKLIEKVNAIQVTELESLPEEIPTAEPAPSTEPEPEPEPESKPWLVPVLIGAGVLVCLVPAILLTVRAKKRKNGGAK